MIDGNFINLAPVMLCVYIGLSIVIGVLAGVLGNGFHGNMKLAKLNREESCTTCPHKDATEAFKCRGCKIGMGPIKTTRNAAALERFAIPATGLSDGDDESLKAFEKGGAA